MENILFQTLPKKVFVGKNGSEWSPTIQRYGCTPSPGWSPTNSRMLNHHPWDGVTFPRMVTHHFQAGQPNIEFDSCFCSFLQLRLLFFLQVKVLFQTGPLIPPPLGRLGEWGCPSGLVPPWLEKNFTLCFFLFLFIPRFFHFLFLFSQ